MPNWCSNKVSIRGTRSAIKTFNEFLNSLPDDEFFNHIRPMPKELINTMSPTKVVSKKEREQYVSGKRSTFGGIPITKEMEKSFKRRFGATNWYNWSLRHWGTKTDLFMHEVNRKTWASGTGMTLCFHTAWTPPIGVINALRYKFPDLHITMSYSEPANGLRGTI